MTDELKEALQRLTCTGCLGNGTLHSRIANPRFATQPVTHTETHYLCPKCGGSGVRESR